MNSLKLRVATEPSPLFAYEDDRTLIKEWHLYIYVEDMDRLQPPLTKQFRHIGKRINAVTGMHLAGNRAVRQCVNDFKQRARLMGFM